MNNITVYPLRVKQMWFINYCYLIINSTSKTALLIDPAWEINTIEEKLKSLEVKLTGILLTHSHLDHVNLASHFANQYNVPVYMSQDEIKFHHFHCPNLIPINHFDPFSLGEINIQPILTPGHTAGGTSYLIEENLFCGDTLFIEGCGICSGKGANPEIMFETLQKLKKIISLQTIIYPGHCYGAPVGQTFDYVLKNNLYLQFDSKESFIAYRMRDNQNNIFKFT
jgi:hydroxyacylglutathione hydrolase